MEWYSWTLGLFFLITAEDMITKMRGWIFLGVAALLLVLGIIEWKKGVVSTFIHVKWHVNWRVGFWTNTLIRGVFGFFIFISATPLIPLLSYVALPARIPGMVLLPWEEISLIVILCGDIVILLFGLWRSFQYRQSE